MHTGSKHAQTSLGIRDLTARNFLIATGSKPREIPTYPADGKRILTSDHIMKLDHIPSSLAIIGAGRQLVRVAKADVKSILRGFLVPSSAWTVKTDQIAFASQLLSRCTRNKVGIDRS